MNILIKMGFFIFFLPKILLGQEITDKYYIFMKKADSLYIKKEYKESAKTYSIGFLENGDLGELDHRYKAACSWALSNEPDSAFYQLFRIATRGKYAEYEKIINDPDLLSLHQTVKWDSLTKIISDNKKKIEKNYNWKIISILDSVFVNDQEYRLEIPKISSAYGYNSDNMKNLFRKMTIIDSINLIKVEAILQNYGWLGPDIIGNQGVTTLFLVIQHSPLEIQQKYFPIMKEAAKNGNLENSELALLEDRMALGKGNCQIYGSQIGYNKKGKKYYILPLIDPENVDLRRSEVGLNTISEYVKDTEHDGRRSSE